jgi:hypothetical protein
MKTQTKTQTWLALGILSLGLAVSQPASAVDFSIGPYGSYYDSDDAGDAWGGGLMGRLGILNWLAVDARASYLDLNDSDIEMIPLEAALTLRLPLMEDKLVPYAGVGVGYYLFDDNFDEDANFEDVDDGFGFFPVVGVELRFGSRDQWAIFGEARWLFLSSDIDGAIDELENIGDADLDGLAVNVGLLYRF